MTERTRVRADLKLRSQLDDAADSVCRNIAEGFGCQDGFRSAMLKRYVTEEDLEAATRLQRRFYKAMSAFLRHLDGGKDTR